MMTSETDRRPEKRGFTLTEIAIVLGIIGLILGAIWTAAAYVHRQNQVKTTVTQLVSAANNLRIMYGSSMAFPDASGTDLGPTMGKYIFAPGDLQLWNGGVLWGMNLWNDGWRVVIGRGTDQSGSVSGDQSHFYFYSGNVPDDICMQVVLMLKGTDATAILINSAAGWAGWQPPSAITPLNAQCWPFGNGANTKGIGVEFALR